MLSSCEISEAGGFVRSIELDLDFHGLGNPQIVMTKKA